ncbi:hypothetical protein F2Q70_00035922 [Brassica cretica]|uniref:Uncharacterized protein n=1 Tax=Brassica cretica TaxID=69181 RepID=A0A8S9JYY1_BRACR|nr:hypothetical protein F2Q70_00035922 [Brassica cretica]
MMVVSGSMMLLVSQAPSICTSGASSSHHKKFENSLSTEEEDRVPTMEDEVDDEKEKSPSFCRLLQMPTCFAVRIWSAILRTAARAGLTCRDPFEDESTAVRDETGRVNLFDIPKSNHAYFYAEENDGEPVDDLALMRRAYTNKKTGQIDDGLVRDVVDLVQTQVVDEVSQLQTEDDASTASTNLSRFRINEIVESSVPKKKGRLVGLGRRSRSAAPSSAPPPYVDPEVLTAQLKDKDDRISALETQMAAQQAGYETQKRLNEQMMEMMKRMYPNEVFPNIQDP